jgi:hypothetical protein
MKTGNEEIDTMTDKIMGLSLVEFVEMARLIAKNREADTTPASATKEIALPRKVLERMRKDCRFNNKVMSVTFDGDSSPTIIKRIGKELFAYNETNPNGAKIVCLEDVLKDDEHRILSIKSWYMKKSVDGKYIEPSLAHWLATKAEDSPQSTLFTLWLMNILKCYKFSVGGGENEEGKLVLRILKQEKKPSELAELICKMFALVSAGIDDELFDLGEDDCTCGRCSKDEGEDPQ